MAELVKARTMKPYIILYKITLQQGVRNLPKVFTRQRPGRESNRVSMIRKSDALPVSHRATQIHTDAAKRLTPATIVGVSNQHATLKTCDRIFTDITCVFTHTRLD